jgi:sterol desaturase/sphingolipid hydroxylase (fatty acid hydroxylase superfamily)
MFDIPTNALESLAGLFEALGRLSPLAISTTWASAIACLVIVESPDFDQTTGLRLSGFDALLTIGYLTPLVVLSLTPELVLIAYGLVVGYQTWIHTEFIKKMPCWFEFVLNTPSHHRAHHGSDSEYLDSNYSGILIIWDRMFGTFAAETQKPTYGSTTQINSSNLLDV